MVIYKTLSKHPRMHFKKIPKKAIVIGGTGATGSQLVKQLLESPDWSQVTTIGRRPVLSGDKNDKLNDIVINDMYDLSETESDWFGHDTFFNCIGTTRSLAGGAQNFVKIEQGISDQAAHFASKANIPHALVISADGANHEKKAVDWIHPLLYIKTIGQKEQTLLNRSFEAITIFRPGFLIRSMNKRSIASNFFRSTGLGLPVDLLASAMIRDAEHDLKTQDNAQVCYRGNRCIKASITL